MSRGFVLSTNQVDVTKRASISLVAIPKEIGDATTLSSGPHLQHSDDFGCMLMLARDWMRESSCRKFVQEPQRHTQSDKQYEEMAGSREDVFS